MKHLAWFVVLLGSGAALRAQQEGRATPEPLTSDRPGFSDGVSVLPAGVLQLEAGFSLSGKSGGGVVDRTFIAGSPLLRLGLGRRLELRAGGDGFRHDSHRAGDAREGARSGASDYSVGAKFRLVSEHGFRPELALISMTSLPVGDERFTSSGIDPTIKLAWSKTLSQSATASGNIIVSSVTNSGARFTQRAVSLQLGRSLWGHWAGFWEGYIVTPAGPGERTWTLDTGASHQMGSNAQIDISVGQQIKPLARCWFVGAGLVLRHPLWFAGRR
jgi:hypothetical protein